MGKIKYRESGLRGKSILRSKAMQSVLKADTKHVLNQRKEQKELFDEMKKYRDHGGVTGKEMRKVLAHFKYKNNSLTKKEVRILAKELGVTHVDKKYLPKDEKPETKKESRLHHAKHEVDFMKPRTPREQKNTKRDLHSFKKNKDQDKDKKSFVKNEGNASYEKVGRYEKSLSPHGNIQAAQRSVQYGHTLH